MANFLKIAILTKKYLELIAVTDTEETPARQRAASFRHPLQNVNNVGGHERPTARQDGHDTKSLSSASAGQENTHEAPSKAEQRIFKKAIKHDRSLKKSARNSERHTVLVRQSDIEQVTQALHGDSEDTSTGSGHPLASDQDLEQVIERNRRFVANIHQHKVYLRKSVAAARRATNAQRKKHRGKAAEADPASDEDAEELVNGVLLQLGINHTANLGKRQDRQDSFCATSPAKIASVMAKLRTAIREDIEKHENEQRQTCIRAGGFWRYCGRPVFDRMAEVAKEIDWRTGEIKHSAEKEEESDREEEMQG